MVMFDGDKLFPVPILNCQVIRHPYAAVVIIPEDFAAADRDRRLEGVHDPRVWKDVSAIVGRPTAFRAFFVIVQVGYAVIFTTFKGVRGTRLGIILQPLPLGRETEIGFHCRAPTVGIGIKGNQLKRNAFGRVGRSKMRFLRCDSHQTSDTIGIRLAAQIIRPCFCKSGSWAEIILHRGCCVVHGLGTVNDWTAAECGVADGVLAALDHINGLRLHGKLKGERVAVLPDAVKNGIALCICGDADSTAIEKQRVCSLCPIGDAQPQAHLPRAIRL